MKNLAKGISQLFVITIFFSLTFEMSTAQNALPKNARNIPTYFSGTVTDCHSGLPLANVMVKASGSDTTFHTSTAEDGTYSLLVVADTFDVSFFLPGMYKDTVFDTLAVLGIYTEVSTSLCEIPFAPAMVFLDPNEPDTKALVSWTWPYTGHEIAYDDGGVNYYSIWVQPGGKSAVRFTPPGYPATVSGGRIYVGDGSFPNDANFLGTDFAVGILDDDGPDGMPGTVLDSITVTVNNYYWVDFNGFNTSIDEGDFYLVMWQLGLPPDAAPIGVDLDYPIVNRSYTAQNGNNWTLFVNHDLMIRAIVAAPSSQAEASIKQLSKSNIQREINSYDLVWIDGFNPDQDETPENGIKHHWPGNETSPYLDVDWGSRDAGFYAYAARANYANDTSEWTYSNVAAHLLEDVVTITIEQCDDSLPDNIEVTLKGKNYPYLDLQGTATIIPSDNLAEMVFDSVIDGAYDLTVFKVGYQKYFHSDIQIFNDYEEYVVLSENTYPARNLYVDSLTSVATWDPALITQLFLEDFEEEEFPPEGWDDIDVMTWGWYREKGSISGIFPVPNGDGYYACAISGAGLIPGVYLITPELDLRESDDFVLHFDHFFNGAYGQSASVKYTTDNGLTWESYFVVEPLSPWAWEHLEVDLSPLSGDNGLTNVRFAFYTTDHNIWASGWAIDNVSIHDGPAPIRGYYVYLDESFVAEVPPEQTTYTYTDLVYGQYYKASVRSMTTCGLSNPISYYFTSTYLYPPRNLHDSYLQDTDEVPLFWFPPKKITEGDGRANRDYPKYGIQKSKIEYGTVSNTLAFNRSSAGDIVKERANSREYGDVVDEVSPQGIQPWGVCFDGEFLYVTDPFGSAGTVINQFNIDGSATGYTIDGSAGGPSWVGDMASDGEFIYACNMGGDNAIQVYRIETGEWVNTVSGAWTVSSQRGLAYDSINMEFYIGGWNSNNIWRTDENGGTIDESGFNGVSGLAWHPAGGPTANGSLWVAENSQNDLVSETDPNAGWPLLQNFGIPSGAGFSSAGLGLNSDGMLWVVNQSNGLIYLVDVDEPLVPVYYQIPEGLTGFKVYQDSQWIADVPYNGEGVEDTILYIVNNVDPACYTFDVSAVYALDSLGFPGEEGESQWEGTDTVCVVWGYELPFIEEWNTGNFTFNEWRPDTDWVIHNEIGDPVPSATFLTEMIIGDSTYSASLTSNPLLGNRLAAGDIYLDFNLRLDDLNNTGDEKLAVEITKDAGKSWQQVTEFNNADGSFDFEAGFQHVNISAQALGYPFQLRFRASGQNASDIEAWFIDNIHVYRTCSAPEDLAGSYLWQANEWGAEIQWDAPELPEGYGRWMFWDNEVYAGGVGRNAGGTWSLAQRWDAGQLKNWQGVDWTGTQITKMRFVLNDDGFESITLKIWSGPDASTLLYEQEVQNPVIGDWVEVRLDNSVDFDTDEELWIGYTINNQAPDKLPGAYDEGPAVPGYGDMISTDGGASWDRISDFGIDNNWIVHAYATPPSSPGSSVVPAGFKLYRQQVEVDDDYLLYDFIAFIEGQNAYSYFDKAPAVSSGQTYNYKVSSLWESESDTCESVPALTIPMTEDYVTVLVTDIVNVDAPEISLYPNPATNRLNISSAEAINQITIYNHVGQVVLNRNAGGVKTVVLNTSSFEAGIYLLWITCEANAVSRRVVIME